MERRLAATILGALLATGLAACGTSTTASRSTTTTHRTTTTISAATSSPTSALTPASPALSTAVTEAFDQEQLTLVTYKGIVGRLGAVAPFTNVITFVPQHLGSLVHLAQAHAIILPSALPTPLAAPATKPAACSLGVTLEQKSIALYNGLLPEVSTYPDAVSTFSALRAAARDRYLPAFQHCA